MTTTTDPHTPTYDELVATVETLQARMAELEAEWANARKDPATSSKPPSSDTVTPKPGNKKRGRPKKRKQVGQPGHGRIPYLRRSAWSGWNAAWRKPSARPLVALAAENVIRARHEDSPVGFPPTPPFSAA
ncbi:MAG: DUF6444 domain-containing protein [Planctomycetota bacterium]